MIYLNLKRLLEYIYIDICCPNLNLSWNVCFFDKRKEVFMNDIIIITSTKFVNHRKKPDYTQQSNKTKQINEKQENNQITNLKQ